MVFDDVTLTILKNFGSINQSILLRKGNVVRTVSSSKTIIGRAKIAQDIPVEAGIYDLNRFLASLNLLDDPDVQFEDDRFRLISGKTKVQYAYTPSNLIMAPPDKDLGLSDTDLVCRFELQKEYLEKGQRASSVLRTSDFGFTVEDEKVFFTAFESKNPTSDTFNVEVGIASGYKDSKTVVATDNVRVLPLSYEVSVYQKLIKFDSLDPKFDLTYYVACEAT